jgi:hypothetical protein
MHTSNEGRPIGERRALSIAKEEAQPSCKP